MRPCAPDRTDTAATREDGGQGPHSPRALPARHQQDRLPQDIVAARRADVEFQERRSIERTDCPLGKRNNSVTSLGRPVTESTPRTRSVLDTRRATTRTTCPFTSTISIRPLPDSVATERRTDCWTAAHLQPGPAGKPRRQRQATKHTVWCRTPLHSSDGPRTRQPTCVVVPTGSRTVRAVSSSSQSHGVTLGGASVHVHAEPLPHPAA